MNHGDTEGTENGWETAGLPHDRRLRDVAVLCVSVVTRRPFLRIASHYRPGLRNRRSNTTYNRKTHPARSHALDGIRRHLLYWGRPIRWGSGAGGARFLGMEKVGGSNPPCSTNDIQDGAGVQHDACAVFVSVRAHAASLPPAGRSPPLPFSWLLDTAPLICWITTPHTGHALKESPLRAANLSLRDPWIRGGEGKQALRTETCWELGTRPDGFLLGHTLGPRPKSVI